MDGTDSKSSLDPREELSPPVFSLTRKSLLFDEDSSPSSDDQGGNDQVLTSDLGKEAGTLTLALWSGAKSVLPPLLTGASETTSGDKDALGSLYNLLFVRLPTVCVGVGYLVNLMQGHPLMMDPFGTGPFEVSPILVLAALWAILRYWCHSLPTHVAMVFCKKNIGWLDHVAHSDIVNAKLHITHTLKIEF
jgi:hypothetical protein